MIEYYCATCKASTPFEQPPCHDGHGDECPEWCCLRCGEAVLVNPPLSAPVIDVSRAAA